jgi:uncharacterized protein
MRRRFLILAGLAALAVVVDAFFIEPYRIEVTHHSLKAAIAAPLKIALVADIHTRGFGSRERKLVQLIESEKPDVILISGDSVGRDNDFGDVTNFLRNLHALLGVWLVNGNWENHSPPKNEHALYASAGVHFLLNETAPIRADVWLLGLDDPSSAAARPDPVIQTIPKGVYTIALFHSPAYFDRIAGRVPLAFAGHTHGGQIRIPFVPVFWLPSGSGRFLEGWYAENSSHMYVTRGIGTSIIRARFLCRPELSIVTLEPSANSEDLAAIGSPQVSPPRVVVQTGASQQFSATVPCTNLPEGAVCPQGITWKSSTGTISGVGNFSAPSTPGTVTVTASSTTDTGKYGTATVSVVPAIPITQTCRAREGGVDSLSCSLPSLAAGHTLIAVVRAHGRISARIGAISDSINGFWPSANFSGKEYFSSIGSLAGGATFFSNTKESSSPVTITVELSGGSGGEEIAVWDFPGTYSLDGVVPAPNTGTTGATPVLAMTKAGDLVFAWSVASQCFLNSLAAAAFADISLPESCNVQAAVIITTAAAVNVSNQFATDGNRSVSGIMVLSIKSKN